VVSGNRVVASGWDGAECTGSCTAGGRRARKESVFLDSKSFESLDVMWNSLPKGEYYALFQATVAK